MASQANSTIHLKMIWCPFSINFFKSLRRNTPKNILLCHHHPNSKTRQRYHQNRKLQANIFYEYRCKNSQQNFSQPNPTTCKKDHTPQSNGIHPRCTRMVRSTYANQSMSYTIFTKEKSKTTQSSQ